MNIVNSCKKDRSIDTLVIIWEASVRATHHFLTEKDIQYLTPLVKTGLSDIETLIVVYDHNKPVAFMGIDATKIEMLFVSPDYFSKGIGKKLATLAIIQHGVQYVDVNEQNPQAIEFYQHIGFEVYERTELDEQGNPFPILKMKQCPFFIRQATSNDIKAMKDLFQNTILTINRRDYSQAEAEDWASCGNNVSRWIELIETQYFIVAENIQSQIVGFSSITPEGYLHYMFVHKDFQNKGIATLLLKNIERHAKESGVTKIVSEVSLTAHSFFEKQGYVVEKKQKRQANHLSLTNFLMKKSS